MIVEAPCCLRIRDGEGVPAAGTADSADKTLLTCFLDGLDSSRESYPPPVQVLSTLLINLAIPKVAIAEHVEHGHEDCAEDNFPDDDGHHLGLLVRRHDIGDDPLDNHTQVCFDRGNVGLGTDLNLGCEGRVCLVGKGEGERGSGLAADRGGQVLNRLVVLQMVGDNRQHA